MDFTGERYCPEIKGEIALEHWQRYALASELASGKDVLDVASGEGYGSSLLAATAKSVVGVEIAVEAVEQAARKYQAANLAFVRGDAACLPLRDNSVDLVTSFETIEHLSAQSEMLAEIRRVLRPDGILFISSPDRAVNGDLIPNRFHVHELYLPEFERLIGQYFSRHVLLGQRIIFASILAGSKKRQEWRDLVNFTPQEQLPAPQFNIVLASNGAELPKLPFSVMEGDFQDAKEKYLGEFRALYDNLQADHGKLNSMYQDLDKNRQELEERHRELWGHHEDLRKQHQELMAHEREMAKESQARHEKIMELEKYIRASEEAHFQKDGKLAELERELTDMKGSRSWKLTAPLRKAMGKARELKKAIQFAPHKLKGRMRKKLAEISGRRRKQIILVSGEPDTPGHVYRMQRLAAALAKDFAVREMRLEQLLPQKQYLEDADLIWLWRAAPDGVQAMALEEAKARGAAIVFDIDDMCFHPDHYTIENMDALRFFNTNIFEVRQYGAKLLAVCSMANLCAATTVPLMRQMSRVCFAPAVVMRNTFDHEYRLKCVRERKKFLAEKEDDFCRIGYAAGTMTHQADVGCVAGALAAVLRKHPQVRLTLFHTVVIDEIPALEAVKDQIEIRERVPLEQLPTELARFDINIAPLEPDNPFCECKSELKFFESALMRVPTVASATAPFREAIEQGVTGFVAESAEEWQAALEKLIDDPKLRDKMGRAAQRAVLWKFGPEYLRHQAKSIVEYIFAPPGRKTVIFNDLVHAASQDALPVAFDLAESDVVFAQGEPTAKVSVVIPLYNYENYITEALDSVLAQTERDIDVIVVNDCSTDGSRDVAEKWLRRHAASFHSTALLSNLRNSGLAAARNTGIDYSESEYIMLLDADNKLLPQSVAFCRAALDNSDAAFAYPTLQTFGDEEYVFSDRAWEPLLLRHGNYIDALAMIRKSAWAAVGGYTPAFGWEDYELWCRFVEHGFWGIHVPEALAQYRVHGKSMLHITTEVGDTRKKLEKSMIGRHPWLRLRSGDD